jgi:hypothetical protein
MNIFEIYEWKVEIQIVWISAMEQKEKEDTDDLLFFFHLHNWYWLYKADVDDSS